MKDERRKSRAPEVAALLEEIRYLLELKGENPFKLRAFEKATLAVQHALQGGEDLERRAADGKLIELEGVGPSIAAIIDEFLRTGKSRTRREIQASLPPGLRDMVRIPGIGRSKALRLIEDLKLRSVRDLEHACREGRVAALKGFGEKAEASILEGIRLLHASSGRLRVNDALALSVTLLEHLGESLNKGRSEPLRIEETGELRRRMETIGKFSYLVELPGTGVEAAARRFAADRPHLPELGFEYADAARFGSRLALLTGSPEHLEALRRTDPATFARMEAGGAPTEDEFYSALGLPWISPELRETGDEVAMARDGRLARLLPLRGLRGALHNHTVWSDGALSVEQMLEAARARGLEYLGIADHSQSAHYARGLKPSELEEQEREVRAAERKHGFRLFWGIESDIRPDGALDYDPEALARFDYVVASIHSHTKMATEEMTERVLRAIANPHTRILGHPTGRLLLERNAYAVDMTRVIPAAAKHGVAIEINSNPARLDMDWRWGKLVRETGALICINADAHDAEGLDDLEYGVLTARKGLIPAAQIVNSWGIEEVERWLRR